MHGEIDLDLRSRVAAVGGSSSKLYDRTVSLEEALAPGLSAKFVGSNRFHGSNVQQATIEQSTGNGRVQAGVIRLPFGIYEHQETYASGLIDYPMPRVDYAYNSVDWGVPGASWSGGTANLQLEAAAVSGDALGDWNNHNHVDGLVGRAQAYFGTCILGISRWDGHQNPFPDAYAAPNEAVHLTGLDIRYTRPHLMMRGEYIAGELAGDQTRGWYLDAYYRLPQLEKWSLVGRVEQLKPGTSDPMSRQITVGVRWVAARDWILSVDLRANNMNKAYSPSWTAYAGGMGDLLFQAYHKITF